MPRCGSSIPTESKVSCDGPRSRRIELASQADQRPGVHQGTPRQKAEHHPPADPRARGTDLGRRRHGDARHRPAAASHAAGRLRTEDAGAGSLPATDGPMEPGRLASGPALRRSIPQNGRLWFNDHPYGILAAETYMILAALDLMGSHQAAEDGFDQWVSLPMDPDSESRASRLGASRPSQRTLLGRARLPDARRRSAGRRRPHGRRPCLRSGFDRLGADRALPADRRQGVVQGVGAADQGQRRMDAAPAACRAGHGSGRRAAVVQGTAAGAPGDAGQRRTVDAVLRVRGVLLGRGRALRRALATIDPAEGARLQAEAEAYRKDLLAAVERSIACRRWCRCATAPSIPSFRSPVTCAGCAPAPGDGSATARASTSGPMYWETVQSAAALISPAGLLSAGRRARAGISRRAGGPVAAGEPECRRSATGLPPAGSTRADWSARRTCTWPAMTSRSFSARS